MNTTELFVVALAVISGVLLPVGIAISIIRESVQARRIARRRDW